MQKPNMLALNTLHTHTDKVRERITRTDHHDTLALAPSLVHTCVSIWHWLYSLCSLSRWSWFRLMSMCAFYVVTFTRNQKKPRESYVVWVPTTSNLPCCYSRQCQCVRESGERDRERESEHFGPSCVACLCICLVVFRTYEKSSANDSHWESKREWLHTEILSVWCCVRFFFLFCSE